jgi:hypothetical protein
MERASPSEVVLEKLLDLAPALADKADDRDIGRGVAGEHRKEHRLADPAPREDAHALPGAGGEKGVGGAHAEIERLADAATGMRRRRVRAEGPERRPERERSLAVDRASERVDDAAEPSLGRPYTGGFVAHMSRAAPPHAFERAERHREGPLAGKPDNLAGHSGAAAGLDLEPSAHMHGGDRPRDLDEEPANAGDAAINIEIGDRFHGGPGGGEPGFALLLHGESPSTFRLRLSLTLERPRV